MTRLIRLLASAAVALALLASPASAAPLAYPPPVFEDFPEMGPPYVTAPSWILYDDSIGKVLASRNADDERSIASTTKIMTGLLTVENADFDEKVTISHDAAITGGQEIGLFEGEVFTVGELFKAMMVRSANDAATALAEHVAGSVDAFVQMMNERADELGLEHTSFTNPHGLDAPGHYSSANDMLRLGLTAMSHPEFAEVVKAKALVMPDAPDGTKRFGISTNLMLDTYPGMMGVKTGLTPHALFTFVGAAERDGRRLYVVVLGSPENFGHFADAKRLLDYGFEDLGFLGDAALSRPYVAVKARVQPDPLVAQGEVETYLHLAGQGLTLDEPAPLNGPPVPEAPEITEVTREPEGSHTSIGDALLFWFRWATGE